MNQFAKKIEEKVVQEMQMPRVTKEVEAGYSFIYRFRILQDSREIEMAVGCEAASKSYPAGKNGRGPDHLLPLWYRR